MLRQSFLFTVLTLLCAIQYSHAGTLVRVETSVGDLYIQLFDDIAPGTVANFLNYVNSGRYDGTVIHRSDPGFVIQGGWITFDEQAQAFRTIETDEPIDNEFSVSNTRGTIAMAKTPGDPNSATGQWFVNLADNSALDSSNGGFTVFARVVGDGMAVIDTIAGLPKTRLVSSVQFEFPLIDFDGQGLTNANLVNVNMAVLPNSFDGESGVLTLAIDAPSVGLLRASFDILSLEDATIQAQPDSISILSSPLANMTTFDAATNRLFIPELAAENGILFRNIVFRLIDADLLIFKLESLQE